MSVNPTGRVVIGTRQSQLATWQAEYIASRLRDFYPKLEVSLLYFITQGDRVLDKPLPQIGGKGVFTADLEVGLLSGEIDLAVHSLKDLPTDLNVDFTIAAIPERASPFDALISRSGQKLAALPTGATVGTSSLRRVAQIRAVRPDLNTLSLRGNVPTRIDRLLADDSLYDAIVLAEAGLDRLQRRAEITEILPADLMLPAPAQGALAVQSRANDERILSLLVPLDHKPTRIIVEAERTFLNALDSGCRLPVAALGRIEGEGSQVHLTGRVISLDGSQTITVEGEAPIEQSKQLGQRLAQAALDQGADVLLDDVRRNLQA